jgi:hypothetical protein
MTSLLFDDVEFLLPCVDEIPVITLIHVEVELVLNDCNTRESGGHFSRLETTQTIIRAGYFWPSLIKDCVEAIKK